MSAGLGISAMVAGRGLRQADGATTGPSTGEEGARAAAVSGGVAPAMAPSVAARVGLGSGNEAGLAYTGRAMRLDARHVWQEGAFALSVGAGASILLAHRDDMTLPTRWSLAPTSVGADVPLLFGWRSSAGIVSLYGGPRVGVERVAGDVTWGAADDAPTRAAVLRHWHAGALVGVMLGFRHVHGALELQAAYHRIDGRVGEVDVGLAGATWTPAAGLVTTF